MDDEGDILDYDMAEVRVSKAIIRQSRQAWLVADQSKRGRRAPVRLASLADVAIHFTDAALPSALAARCREWSTQVVVAGS
jgi:DeoR family transcriptional regulator, glycerol-3-phosphate regulon repressor